MQKIPPIFFDTRDYQLLQIVDDVLDRGPQSRGFRSLFTEQMHPHGIKEMAAPLGLRIAYAVVSLLGTFEKGRAHDRLKALRSLKNEIFLSSPSYYQKNRARVLLQIMKELVRSDDNELHRLKLAHDFRMVSAGNPYKIRKELAKYHLVEMPEEWKQLSFDDHVHDANTKGRKSPTHLIMDAWIKGIRSLTVVYYNYVRPEVIEELLEAGSILDISVQVGIEVSCRFRNRYVRFTWEPCGFADHIAFLKFLRKDRVMEFFEEGRAVSHYQQKYVFDVLVTYNDRHRLEINREFGLDLAPLSPDEFTRFVGTGQPSILHLARFIHNSISNHIGRLYAAVEASGGPALPPEARDRIGKLNIETIIANYLTPAKNPEVHDPTVPHNDMEPPNLLQCGIHDLLSRLLTLQPSSRFTLNLGNLSAQDTLELLYAGAGMITHIEAYNLKDADHGMSAGVTVGRDKVHGDAVQLKNPEAHYSLISQLQDALNDDNVISLKNAIREIIIDHDDQLARLRSRLKTVPIDKGNAAPLADELRSMQRRKLELIDILSNLESFHNSYRKRNLDSRIGSGSTGQAEHRYGMGFVVVDTLPARAQKQFFRKESNEGRTRIPVSALTIRSVHNRRYGSSERRSKSLFSRRGGGRWEDWTLNSFRLHIGRQGNIGTLGGQNRRLGDGITIRPKHTEETLEEPWKYLNTNLKNSLKVLIGFIPAFLTFFLTKDWWLLAYFGAVIWFGITGSRNIIQSVLGGGGLHRSPLLPWNSLVSWSRISDSLLYTGFSVPLLDFVVKTLLLDRTFGVTTSTNPVLLYAVMGLANGIYISSHNTIRGLPRGAVIGNFFRSILAIPMAILINGIVGALLGMAGVVDVSGALQKWAAIISKFASDCVAAFIEGIADRQANIQARLNAYRAKLSQLYSVFARLDLLFPEEDVLVLLQSPKIMMQTLNKEARELEKLIIVNALDLMYFWFYQPRSKKALSIIHEGMSEDEWLIFYRSQLILKRHKEISQVFVDGLVGNYFSKALSFYLDRSSQYMTDMEKLGKQGPASS